jgi:hypothetical protein
LLAHLRSKCLLIFVLVVQANLAAAEPTADGSITADQIVARVAERNKERAANLKGYTSKRSYHLLYKGFPGTKEAEMVLEARFDAPSSKQFQVVSESGSKYIINKVFRRLLTGEQEALNRDNQQETAMTTENYEFRLEREERENDHHYYVLHAQPKRKNKFLFRGLVWIDANDFAVARIEAEPAKSPSFWISKTAIEHRYVKVGDFWLPAKNISKTDVRLGGEATLIIDYGDYSVSSQMTQVASR